MEKYTKKILPILTFVLINFIFIFKWNTDMDFFQWLGFILTYVCFFLWFWARKNLGKSYSLLPEARELKKHGFYKKIRHPLYIFQLGIVFSFILYTKENILWFIFIYIFILQIYRIKKEEDILLKKFGNKYIEYKKSTWF